MSIWMIVGPAVAGALFLWLLHGCVQLDRLMRQAERDQRIADQLVRRYGGSLSWNDEDRAQLGGRPVSDATRSRKG